MAGETFQVIFDGPALAEHKMDVHELAPALLALGDLIREANKEINGARSRVNVFVRSDIEHGCISITLELVQSILSQVQALLADENVKSAKEILEWIGLIGGSAGAAFTPLLLYMKLRKGRKIVDQTEIKDTDKSGVVSVKFDGDDNHIEVHQHIYNLGENPKAKRAVAGSLSPLEREGVESFKTRDNTGRVTEIEKAAASDISESCGDVSEEITHEPQTVVAHLKVYSPVFDPAAPRWRFEYGQERIYADISDTSIARDAVERGVVADGDIYRVTLQITEHETPTHQFRNEYKILNVLDFIPSPRQQDLFVQGLLSESVYRTVEEEPEAPPQIEDKSKDGK